ncbi:MAG: hypothetical protein K8U03_06325 [Planctomycetia bacterium]|nr:hypothetical protein [Planctomycetia bacterium]
MLGSGRSSDDRRRRLLTDENIAGGTKASSADGPDDAEPTRAARNVVKSSNRYGATARMERQNRVTDLLPQSYGMLALAFFVGVLFIAGLEAGYYYLPLLSAHSASGRIDALNLSGEGSLAAWFSTTTLSLAAFAAWVVYSVRKHRADDYHGRYRVWLGAALAWLFLGVDESASLHEAFRDLMIGTTGQHGFGDGSIWWIGAYGLVLTVVGVRLLLDMRECRTSTVALGLTAVCYVATTVVVLNVERGWLPHLPNTYTVMLKEGMEMVGNLFLLTSMLVHARYVILEAQGEITPRAVKPKKEKPKTVVKAEAGKAEKVETAKATAEAKPSGGLGGWFRRAKIDPPHKTPTAPARKTSDLDTAPKAEKVASSSAFRSRDEAAAEASVNRFKKVKTDFAADLDEDDDEERGDNRKLSKADRKALRRQKESERRGYGD